MCEPNGTSAVLAEEPRVRRYLRQTGMLEQWESAKRMIGMHVPGLSAFSLDFWPAQEEETDDQLVLKIRADCQPEQLFNACRALRRAFREQGLAELARQIAIVSE